MSEFERLVDEWGFLTPIPELVIERMAELGVDAFAVFCYLRYRTNKDRHIAWPGYEDMEKRTGLRRERIAAALRALELGGFLVRIKRFGQSTQYRLIRPPDVAPQDEAPSSSPTGGLLENGPAATVVRQADSSSPDVRTVSSPTGGLSVVRQADGIQDSVNQDSPNQDGGNQNAASSPPKQTNMVRCEICGFWISRAALGMRCEGAHFVRTSGGKVGVGSLQ